MTILRRNGQYTAVRRTKDKERRKAPSWQWWRWITWRPTVGWMRWRREAMQLQNGEIGLIGPHLKPDLLNVKKELPQ